MKEKIKELQEKLRNAEKVGIKQQERYAQLDQKYRDLTSFYLKKIIYIVINFKKDPEAKEANENLKKKKIESLNLLDKKKSEENGTLEVLINYLFHL